VIHSADIAGAMADAVEFGAGPAENRRSRTGLVRVLDREKKSRAPRPEGGRADPKFTRRQLQHRWRAPTRFTLAGSQGKCRIVQRAASTELGQHIPVEARGGVANDDRRPRGSW